MKHESSSSDEAMSPTSVPNIVGTISTRRSQRASKTVALTRITNSSLKINNVVDEDDEDEDEDEDDDEDNSDSDVTEDL